MSKSVHILHILHYPVVSDGVELMNVHVFMRQLIYHAQRTVNLRLLGAHGETPVLTPAADTDTVCPMPRGHTHYHSNCGSQLSVLCFKCPDLIYVR